MAVLKGFVTVMIVASVPIAQVAALTPEAVARETVRRAGDTRVAELVAAMWVVACEAASREAVER